MNPTTSQRNMEAGFGFYGDPKELRKNISQMCDITLKSHIKEIEGDFLALGHGRLRKDYYTEIALMSDYDEEHAQKMIAMDDEYYRVLKKELHRRNLD